MLDENDYVHITKMINEYEFINQIGRLDLEQFCVMLATCMLHDETGFSDARADYFHDLLVELIAQRSPDMLHKWVQGQKLIDWTPKDAYLYPAGIRTYIHISALVMHGDAWISLIGSHILKIPNSECRPEYFGWIRENWNLTYSFISAYHDALWSKIKRYDAEAWEITNPHISSLETLRLCTKEGIEYDAAQNKLSIRNKSWAIALERIKKSIDAEFHLEAITITENIISNILYNWISDKQKISKDFSFNKLIKFTRDAVEDNNDKNLFHQLDEWRSERNSAIHRFVTSSIKDIEFNENKFQESSKITAESGLKILKDIFNWYRWEAVNFMEHKFPRTTLNS